jgi:hypothetical protein
MRAAKYDGEVRRYCRRESAALDNTDDRDTFESKD